MFGDVDKFESFVELSDSVIFLNLDDKSGLVNRAYRDVNKRNASQSVSSKSVLINDLQRLKNQYSPFVKIMEFVSSY